jgi:hypothetical protein
MEIDSEFNFVLLDQEVSHCSCFRLRKRVRASVIFSTWVSRRTFVILCKCPSVIPIEIYTWSIPINHLALLLIKVKVLVLSVQFDVPVRLIAVRDHRETINIDNGNEIDSRIFQSLIVFILLLVSPTVKEFEHQVHVHRNTGELTGVVGSIDE